MTFFARAPGALFLTLEGIDGAGKSTQLARLVEGFRAQGRGVTQTREPGGTPLAETLRGLVLNEAMDPMTEALLVFAARREHVLQVIAPALARGEVVVCDRFADASFAYQGAGRGFDWQVLTQLETWVQAGLQPDVTVWLDLPAEVAAERLAGTRVPDKFEAQPVEFFRRVSQGYARRAEGAPQRFVRARADQAPEAVWTDIVQGLRAKGVWP